MTQPLTVLVLCNRPAGNAEASTVIDHLEAFGRYSRHRVQYLSFLRRLPARLDLARFDVIIIHYTIAVGFGPQHFLSPDARARIGAFDGLKVQFLQDEYRDVNMVTATLRDLGTEVLFTCFPEREIEKVYPAAALPGVRKVNNLTGFVPERLLARRPRPIAARPIALGYRARIPPFWLGRLGAEKWQIVDKFKAHVPADRLRMDLSYAESDRIYGEKWIEFVSSCKAMLGVESGASVIDFSGELRNTVDQYVRAAPGASFEEVDGRFLRAHEEHVRMNQISPRCFEAAALGTAMVLYEGEYSGVLEPGRHYIPLRKDFQNIDEVVRALKDDRLLQDMADRARSEVAENPKWSYREFVRRVDRVIDEEWGARRKRRAGRNYSAEGLVLVRLTSPMFAAQRAALFLVHRFVLGTRLRHILFGTWERMPEGLKETLRPMLRMLGK